MRNIDITQISEFPFVITGAQAVFDQDGEMLLDENGNPRTVFARSNDIWDENEGKTQSDLNKELKSAKPAIATITTPGIVQPDGDTITVDANGKIKVKGGGSSPVPEGVLTKDDVQNTLNAEGQSEMVNVPLSAAAGYRLNQRLALDIPVADGVTITVDKDLMPRVAKAYTAAVSSESKQLATGAQIYTAIHSEIENKVDKDTITILNGKLSANTGESTSSLATKGQVSAAILAALAGFSPSGGGVNVIGSESILITPGENASTISANTDTKATSGSGKLLTSGTIYTALKEITDSMPENTDDIDYYDTNLTNALNTINDALWVKDSIKLSAIMLAASTAGSWSQLNNALLTSIFGNTNSIDLLIDQKPIAVSVEVIDSGVTKTLWSLNISRTYSDGLVIVDIMIDGYNISFKRVSGTTYYAMYTVQEAETDKNTDIPASSVQYTNTGSLTRANNNNIIRNAQTALDVISNNAVYPTDVAVMNSLSNLPIDRYTIRAEISSVQPTISFNGTPKDGAEYVIDIINNSGNSISQPLPMTLTSVDETNKIVWLSDNTAVDIDPYAISEISIKVIRTKRKFLKAIYSYAQYSTSTKTWTITDTVSDPSSATYTVNKSTSEWDSENNKPTAVPSTNVLWRIEEDVTINPSLSDIWTTYYIKS